MKIHYITIDYDKYWHQLVFGYAIYKIGQGLIHWQRLFGLGKAKHIIMTEFKFKITLACNYSYEYTVRANEKLDAFAKINAYINERYASPCLIKYELLED